MTFYILYVFEKFNSLTKQLQSNIKTNLLICKEDTCPFLESLNLFSFFELEMQELEIIFGNFKKLIHNRKIGFKGLLEINNPRCMEDRLE